MEEWSSFVAILDSRRVLLTLDSEYKKWGLAGGRRDPEDKSPKDTAIRETKEEIGLQVEVSDLCIREPHQTHQVFTFLGSRKGGQIELFSKEVLDARWFPINALPSVMFSSHRKRLQHILSEIGLI